LTRWAKKRLRDALNLVKLKNVKDKAQMKISFDGGVLENALCLCFAH